MLSEKHSVAHSDMVGKPVTQRSPFRLAMLSAVIVTVLRIAAPYEIANDQGTQLEAAGRFASGLGITTTNHSGTSASICEPTAAKALVWFPPGYSIVVGMFLSTGAALLPTLKTIGAAGTLVGWLGWSYLIAEVLCKPIEMFGLRVPMHLFLACSLPLLTTPQWNRTDLFLWAGVPYFVLLLTDRLPIGPLWASGMAAALVGMEIAIRYASAFLVLAGVLLIWQTAWPNRREVIRRNAVFLGVLALASIPVVVALLKHLQHPSQLPAGAMTTYMAGLQPAEAVSLVVGRLSGISNLVFGGPQVMQVVLRTHNQTLSNVFGIVCLIVVLALPFLLWKRHTGSEDRKADLAISFALVSLSLVIFLSVAGFGSYFSVSRYFLPLLYFPLLIAYQVASASGLPGIAARLVLAVCTASFLSAGLMVFSTNRKWLATYAVLGYRPGPTSIQTTSLPLTYPQIILHSRVEHTRQEVVTLSKAHPDATFFAQQYGYFIYDGLAGGPRPGERFRPVPSSGRLSDMAACGPQQVFWVVGTDRDFDLVPPSMQQVVFEDRRERMRIVETKLPAGYKFRSP